MNAIKVNSKSPYSEYFIYTDDDKVIEIDSATWKQIKYDAIVETLKEVVKGELGGIIKSFFKK